MAPPKGPAIPDFLADQRDAANDSIQHYFLQFEDFWERKLWHELTDSLIEFYALPESAQHKLPLWKNFITTFADKINKLKLVTLGLSAAEQLGDDRNVRLDFVQKIIPKVDPPVSKDKDKESSASKSASSKDAKVYLQVEVASLLLYLQRREEARTQLDECEKTLEDFDSVENVVHAAFYKVNAEYYQTQMDFAAYYKNALLYLACINIDELNEKERRVRAYDLSIAALVSDSIYNFGELLLHPILSSLENTEHAWLRELLFLFNRGDLKAYNVLEANLSKNNLLGQHRTFLIQKISLAALTELVFRRPPHDRALTFTTIGKETNVKTNDVEHLVMKALSLGLVKGQIDQVAEIARINWVQPKVLDMKQIESMRSRLREWDGSVNRLGNWIEGVGKDVWAA